MRSEPTGRNVTLRTVPGSTYRLQLTPEFGFAEAGQLAGYLAGLGVTHAYLSPVLQAVPGSRHGYDITDHSRIRDELGGEDGFREMAARLRAAGLGIVIDIVPNHMAVPRRLSLNRQLWSVLSEGPESACANWFDIDWAAGGGRMALPILAGSVASCLPDLRVDPGGGPGGVPVLRYFEHELPLRQGTAGLPLPDLLAAQHYRLAGWRETATELNWRRFFDVSELIAVRVEDPAVFAATHEVILRLVTDGLVDGLRVDHPDGLADPRGYLRRLSAQVPAAGAWMVAEKILAADERLPADWACAGTTGYDALRLVDGLFVDPYGAGRLSAEYSLFDGADRGVPPFAEVAYAAKLQIAQASLAPEVARLTRLLCALRPDATREAARTVLTEVIAQFEVYRAYAEPGEAPPDASLAAVRRAVVAAARRLLWAAALARRRGGRPRARGRRVRRGRRGVHGQVPADDGTCARQGHRGHRLLPLAAARLAERGGRRPGPLRRPAHGVPRAGQPAGGGLARHDDHAVHARHEAAGGRSRQAGGALRGAGAVGAACRAVA